MEEAVDKIVSLSSDPNFISEIEKKQIEEYARGVALEQAEERGKKEGEKSKQIEIAKKMLEKYSDIDFISECTGLSIKEINDLKV